jgi:arylsulfatase
LPAKRIANAFISVTDVAPTLLDLAGLKQPGSFAGHAILPIQGHSLTPLLIGDQTELHQPTEAVGSELFYRSALRKGDWKAVFLPSSGNAYPRKSVGTGTWQLFNIESDPAEAHDLAASEPAKLRELVADWNSYARDKGVVLPAHAAGRK